MINTLYFWQVTLFLIQDDLDPASKYFTEMLAMQTTQMKWKKQLVQLKIKTEMLKQEVLKKQLEVPEELEESSDSDGRSWRCLDSFDIGDYPQYFKSVTTIVKKILFRIKV